MEKTLQQRIMEAEQYLEFWGVPKKIGDIVLTLEFRIKWFQSLVEKVEMEMN